MNAAILPSLLFILAATSMAQPQRPAKAGPSIPEELRALLKERPTIAIDAYVPLTTGAEQHFSGHLKRPEAATALDKFLATYHFNPTHPFGSLAASVWMHITLSTDKRKMELWLIDGGDEAVVDADGESYYFEGGNDENVSMKLYESIIKIYPDDFPEVPR